MCASPHTYSELEVKREEGGWVRYSSEFFWNKMAEAEGETHLALWYLGQGMAQVSSEMMP